MIMMMKSSVLLTFIAALLFGACSREESEPCPDSAGLKEVNFRIYSALSTRAGKDNFETGDSIGIYAVKRTVPGSVAIPGVSGNQAHNAKWVKTEKGWKPAGPMDKVVWAQDGEPRDFYAYWPYSGKASRPDSMVFAVNDMPEADVLRAANVQGLTDGEVELAFEHALSLVEVEILGGHIDLLPELAVKAINVKTKTAWNIGTATFVHAADGAPTAGFAVADADKHLFRVVLPPQEIGTEVPFLQCNNGDAAYMYTPAERISLTAGSLQKMKITLKQP